MIFAIPAQAWLWGVVLYLGIGVWLATAFIESKETTSRHLRELPLMVLFVVVTALLWPVVVATRLLVRRYFSTYND